MAVSRRLRFEILRRDNYTCRYCGAQAPDVKLTVDHIVPVTLGGGDEPNNLVAACKDCNEGKASIAPDSPIVEDVDAAAMLFAKAMERAVEARRQTISDLQAQQGRFLDHWSHVLEEDVPGGGMTLLPRDWPISIERFLALGLMGHDLEHLMNVTYDRGRPPRSSVEVLLRVLL